MSNDKINLPILDTRDLSLDILRLDTIHPVISGNKLFKLSGYLAPLRLGHKKHILTFGGAWSNHIVATAYAARSAGLHATGLIRGERADTLSQTLIDAQEYGMDLEFLSRTRYKQISGPNAIPHLETQYPDTCIIPEGGAGKPGIEGAKKILSLTDTTPYTHIACAIGTGTMFQGILAAAQPHQTIIGVPVIKGFDTPETPRTKYFTRYHSGGYARHTPELISFMNDFYKKTNIPTDFVYTAKLCHAILNEVQKDFFPPQSRILLIHSGGLQGNRSLPAGVLYF